MGITPTLDVYGDDCLACYAAGKTPLTLKVFFGGIIRGSAWRPEYGMPPNGYHDIVQDPVHPCQWWKNKGDFPNIWYRASNASAILWYEVAPVKYAFGQSLAPVCSTYMVTEFDNDWGLPFYLGTAHIMTPAKMTNIIESVTPMIDPDPRMECFPMEDGLIVVRYAGKRDATNVYIKFDTDA